MGRRGPRPTPTNILNMRGSWRATARTDEPEPERDTPACPKWLRPAAKRAWRELVPQLEGMGILGTCDRNALIRYCEVWARWRAAEEFLIQSGDMYVVRGPATSQKAVGPILAVKEYPQSQLAIRLADQLLKLEREFGLTPSARASMAKPRDNANENRGKDRFFKKVSCA